MDKTVLQIAQLLWSQERPEEILNQIQKTLSPEIEKLQQRRLREAKIRALTPEERQRKHELVEAARRATKELEEEFTKLEEQTLKTLKAFDKVESNQSEVDDFVQEVFNRLDDADFEEEPTPEDPWWNFLNSWNCFSFEGSVGYPEFTWYDGDVDVNENRSGWSLENWDLNIDEFEKLPESAE